MSIVANPGFLPALKTKIGPKKNGKNDSGDATIFF